MASPVHIERSVTIHRRPEDLYRFWRNFSNLPQFTSHLQTVTVYDDKRSHWVTKGPLGGTVEWDAIVTEDVPNRRLAWRTVEGADVDNAGTVEFIPANDDAETTVVHVSSEYSVPGGMLGQAVLKLFGEEPGQQMADDLQHFKELMETGQTAEGKVGAA